MPEPHTAADNVSRVARLGKMDVEDSQTKAMSGLQAIHDLGSEEKESKGGREMKQAGQQVESPLLSSGTARPITCDQVAWVLNALRRLTPEGNLPAVSRQREMLVYAALYEIMEVAHLKFADDAAIYNGTPPDIRRRVPPEAKP